MTSKIVVNNIEADAGISTVTFVSEVTAPTFNGNIVGTAATFTTGTFSGNVDIAGALTYEDVTNVDSVGIITARSGLHVTSGLVGIGTDNPTNAYGIDKSLHVHSSLSSGTRGSGVHLTTNASGNTANDGVSMRLVDTDLSIDNRESGLINFLTAGTERLRITSAGKLILTPGADSGNILQLNGADTTSELLEAGITSGHVQFTATHASGGSNTCGFIFRTRTGSSGTTEKLRITSAGTLESYSPDDTTPNIRWRSDDTNWFGALNQSVHGGTITSFLSCGGDWSANGTTYSATKALAAYPTSAIAVHNQYNNSWGSEFVFLTKAGGSSTTDGAVTERLRISNTGELSISGTKSGNNISDAIIKFNIVNSNGDSKKAEIKANKLGDISSDLIFSTTASHTFAERFRISEHGRVGVNDSTSGWAEALQVSALSSQGQYCLALKISNNSGYFMRFGNGTNNPCGSVSSSGGNSTSFNTSWSDSRRKKNFENWNEEVLPLFKTLEPKKFNFTHEDDGTEKTKGYVAQDVVNKFPEAYPLLDDTDVDEQRYMFNPSGMTIYLMKALQEEIAKREALEARIAALEGS